MERMIKIRFRRISRKLNDLWDYLWERLPVISFAVVFIILIVAYIKYEVQYRSTDVVYWNTVFQYCWHELDSYSSVLITMILFITTCFVAFIIIMNFFSYKQFTELSQLELKKRYADFLFMWLIENVKKVNARNWQIRKAKELSYMHSFMAAHKEMGQTLENMCADAELLLTPDEVAVLLPRKED